MKKLLIALAICFISTNVMALEGTIDSMLSNNTGVTKVRLANTAGGLTGTIPIIGTAEAQKAMIALALTAKSTGATVDLWYGTVDGSTGWYSVTIK